MLNRRCQGVLLIVCGILSAGCLGLLLLERPVLGCAAAPPPDTRLRIEQEKAIIVWDANSGIEHFVRQAQFDTTAKDFGFLVPTPTEPELGEAADGVFSRLTDMTAPKIQFVTKRVPRSDAKASSAVPDAAPTGSRAVQVLQEKTVAGLDAVVLKADDPEALANWLQERGYAFRDELKNWLKVYTDQKWIITAFKLGSGNSELPRYKSSAIRMSFKTDTPFYPYREPEDMRDVSAVGGQPRQLRVFLMASQRMSGTIGSDGQTWPASTVWSKSIGTIPGIIDDLKISPSLQNHQWWLTEFEDNSSPRPGTDEVYFTAASNQNTVERPAIIREIIQYYDEPSSAVSPLVWGIVACSVIALILLSRVFVNLLHRQDNDGNSSPAGS